MNQPLILPVHGMLPSWGERCYIAPNATITGDVVMGDDCSVWFQAVIRGDVHQIRIGNKVNIQDGAVLHATYQKAPLHIGNEVSIGHRAIVHGCTVEDHVLIGMGAIVMDHAVLKKGCLIAAGAVVLENTIVESGEIYAGIPAKRVKQVDEKIQIELVQRISNNYPMYASWYQR